MSDQQPPTGARPERSTSTIVIDWQQEAEPESPSRRGSAPPPPPDWTDRTADHPPEPRPHIDRISPPALALVMAAGLFGNFSLQTGVSSVASPIGVIMTAGALIAAGIATTRRSYVLLGAAIVIALWLPIRSSGWLTQLNGWTAMALLLGAATFASGPAPQFSIVHIENTCERLLASRLGGRLFRRSAWPPAGSPARAVAAPIARGLTIAAVPITVLATLLANADQAFSSALAPGFSEEAAINHSVLTVLGVLSVSGLVAIGQTAPHPEIETTRPVGAIESLVVLASVAVLFGVFAVFQLVGALGGLDKILTEHGLTRAEYARSGFFQLLWVAALTLGLLLVLRAVTRRDDGDRITTALGVAGAFVSLLTVVIVASSIIRLGLYTDAFGLTTLRWYSTAFAWLLGVVFVLLAASYVTSTDRSWFGWSTLAVTLGALIVINVLNPEARVAEHNLTRAPSVVPLDADYLVALSADAWPTVLDHRQTVVAGLSANQGEVALRQACEDAKGSPGLGPLAFNLGRSRVEC